MLSYHLYPEAGGTDEGLGRDLDHPARAPVRPIGKQALLVSSVKDTRQPAPVYQSGRTRWDAPVVRGSTGILRGCAGTRLRSTRTTTEFTVLLVF